MKISRFHIFLVLLILSSSSLAKERIVIGGFNGINPDEKYDNYSIALAISGGGARGLSTIGILKAFEEKNINVASIAGVSMGGIIGGLYASGYTPAELEKIISQLAFDSLFSNTPERKTMFLTQREEHGRHLFSIRFDNWKPVIPKELTKGQKITSLLTSLTTKANYKSGSNFDKLPIPFRTSATDIISGKEIILDNGSLADAMRATMAFPLAFSPVEKDGYLLMDGGMLTPIPVEIARSISDTVDFVVAINTASNLLTGDELRNPIDIANQVTTIMSADRLKTELSKADYIITPPIEKFESSDFDNKDSIIAIGYAIGLQSADSIKNIIESHTLNKSYFIKSVRCNNFSDSTRAFIQKYFSNREVTRNHLIGFLKTYYKENNLFEFSAELEPVTQAEITNASFNLTFSFIPKINLTEYDFEFQGNFIYSDSQLMEQFHFTQTNLIPLAFNQGYKIINDFYKSEGNDLVCVKETKIDVINKKIIIIIDEAIIVGIDVENNERSHDWFIRSYFPLEKGEPYSTKKASQGMANIYGTDLFNQVSLCLKKSPDGSIVKIGVVEKKYQQIRLGWHWDDEYKSEEFIEYLDDNVFGMGFEYLIHNRFAIDRQNIYGVFRANRLWSTYLTAQIKLSYNSLDRQIYDENEEELHIRKESKTGFAISLGQQIERFGTVTGTLNFESNKYRVPPSEQSSQFDLRTFSIASSVDNLDRVPFTHKGTRNYAELQTAGKFLGGDKEYSRFNLLMEIFLPVGNYLNYHPKLLVGLSSELPISEQFYLGGIHSFYGFRTFQLSGDKYLMFSNELRLKLPYNVYFSFRHDLGDVYTHTDEIKTRNLRSAVGFMLAIDSPIGPFEFAYGIADKETDRFYINIGLNF
ncbi:MAG: patatin-like phospholipase family protein [candidate division Zixibacteria bacterium]|nr:patatin-like phospholipase family protein [candidate division Zixibacteria bacterium]